MSIISCRVSGLGEIIRRNNLNERFYIPKYQRPYAWEKEQLVDLWEDLSFLVNGENEMHFYGQIVIHKETTQQGNGSTYYIIDGQQRITTSYLLIRAFLNGFNRIYQKYRDPNCQEARVINRRIIEVEQLMNFDSNLLPAQQQLFLFQNELDNDFFVKLICLDEEALNADLSPKSSKYKMRAAYEYFNRQVRLLLNQFTNPLDMYTNVNNYYSKFIGFFKAMYLEDDSLGEAYTIFETLNDRGKDLASADLLKNYLLANSVNVDEAYRMWNRIVENLDNIDVTKFVRAAWNSSHPFVRDKKLYSKITEYIQRDSHRCYQFLLELTDCSLLYHDLCEPSNPRLITNTFLLDSLKGLKTLGSITWMPLILAIYKAKDSHGNRLYDFTDISNVVVAIETYVFKNFTIMNSNPNEAEVWFSNLAERLSNGELAFDNVVQNINGAINQGAFEAAFNSRVFNESEKEKLRYIFRKIHKHLDNINEINFDNTEVHIEHIMPDSWQEYWPECADYHDDYLWKIGNLCLLSGPLNIEVSNREFSFKKENAYRLSNIRPNSELCNYEQWGVEEIENRQARLLHLVEEIWN